MKEETLSYEGVLTAYLSLWQNRQVNGQDLTAEQILQELVRRELLDENAHPRARKSMHEKFYLSVKRLSESPLSESVKSAIVALYVTEFERILAIK